MSRYIDADLLMQKWLFRGKSQAMYRDEIRSVPTADVVEVVRCKDCKFQKVEYGWNCKRYKVCINFDLPMDDEDFCSWGERREDGEIH